MKFWKLFDWKNHNTPAKNFQVTLGFLTFIIITYVLGSSSNINYTIFFIFIILITRALISFFIMFLLIPISKFIFLKLSNNPEIIKEKWTVTTPEYLGALRYYLLEKIAFHMNGLVLILSYLIIFPIAKITNNELILITISIIIILSDFIIRQNTLRWRWKNPEEDHGLTIYFEWKHSKLELFLLHFIQLLIIPGIILFLFLSDFNLYHLSETSLKLPIGYLYNGLGTMMLGFNFLLLLSSFTKPELVWETITDMTLQR
jgi:hypothetical protein